MHGYETTSRAFSRLVPALAAASLSLVASGAHALVAAYRQPIDAMGQETMYPPTSQDTLSVNPGREVVVSQYGDETVSSVELDQTQGTIKGYASYKLDQDTTVRRPATPGLVNVDGKLIFIGHVEASEGAAPVGPQSAVVEMSVHGSFKDIVGQPWLALAGALSVSHYIGGLLTGIVNDYASTVSFSNVTKTGWVGTIDAQLENTLTGVSGNDPSYPETVWAAGTRIDSSAPDDLLATLRISVPIAEGDDLILISLLGAVATHSYAQLPEPVPVGDDILVRASSGAVDFSNTGLLRIYMPQGLTLTGANAPSGEVLVSAPVPEPVSWALMLAGVGAVSMSAAMSRRRHLALVPAAQHPA